MIVIHPTHGVSLKQYYTPNQKYLNQIPDFSLDRPTCFFTEAYYNDPENRGMRLRTEEELTKLDQSEVPPSETPPPSVRSLVPQHKKILIKYRCTTDGVETRSPIVFIGQQDGDFFNKIAQHDCRVNGITNYVAPAFGNWDCVNRPLYGYGVLRYVINDHMMLDRVLFNVPSMLSVTTDNRHNQFCTGEDCKADVVDILTVSSVKSNGTYLMADVNLPLSKPRVSICQHRRHSFNHSHNYQWNWKQGHRYVFSDLRAPVASDFAFLGTAAGATESLEAQFAHAMANPPLARERWEDFPIRAIVTVQ